jgi:hypothetical protein
MLEEGVSDHRHKRMTVKALRGSSLEVVKTEFFFHLLVSLLASPTRVSSEDSWLLRDLVSTPARALYPPT